MTPEEMGAALGPEWVEEQHDEDAITFWTKGEVTVAHGGTGEWWLCAQSMDCASGEAAVAVAHLLVAAERVAGGAEVVGWPVPSAFAAARRVERCVPPRALDPAEARGLALDLLRAADEAESL